MSDTMSTIDPRPLVHDIVTEARWAQDVARPAREQAEAMAREVRLPEERAKAEAKAVEVGPKVETILAAMPGDLSRLPGPDAESLREIRVLAVAAQMLCLSVPSMYDRAETVIARVKTRSELPYVKMRLAGLVGLDENIRGQLARVQGALDTLAQRRAERGDDAPPIQPNSYAAEPPRRRGSVRRSATAED